jgi:hypothetical protein
MTTETLTPKQVAFEIRFALGQAQASHFIAAHAKSPEARLRALEALTAIIAARFEVLTVTRALPAGWDQPLCGRPVSMLEE